MKQSKRSKEFFFVGNKLYAVVNGELKEVRPKLTYKDLAKISVQKLEEQNLWKTK